MWEASVRNFAPPDLNFNTLRATSHCLGTTVHQENTKFSQSLLQICFLHVYFQIVLCLCIISLGHTPEDCVWVWVLCNWTLLFPDNASQSLFHLRDELHSAPPCNRRFLFSLKTGSVCVEADYCSVTLITQMKPWPETSKLILLLSKFPFMLWKSVRLSARRSFSVFHHHSSSLATPVCQLSAAFQTPPCTVLSSLFLWLAVRWGRFCSSCWADSHLSSEILQVNLKQREKDVKIKLIFLILQKFTNFPQLQTLKYFHIWGSKFRRSLAFCTLSLIITIFSIIYNDCYNVYSIIMTNGTVLRAGAHCWCHRCLKTSENIRGACALS